MKSTSSDLAQPKAQASRATPSQLIKKQLVGGVFNDEQQKPRIVEFLNLADYSINTESYVSIDEPLFEPIPSLIQFSDYEPLQIREKVHIYSCRCSSSGTRTGSPEE